MNSVLALTLATCLSGVPMPAQAPDEVRIAGVRLASRAAGGRVNETVGLLIVDGRGRQARFEKRDQGAFVVPYGSITALHSERSGYPPRFLRRSSHYLTLHFQDDVGQSDVATFRLLEARDAEVALEALVKGTGLVVDRTDSHRSLLGMSIWAAPGDRVHVTDETGRTTTGTISQISPTSVSVAPSGAAGVPVVFGQSQFEIVRRAYSPRSDALKGLGGGALGGAMTGAMVAGLGGAVTAGERAKVALLLGAIGGGLGALVGTVAGAAHYPFNGSYDVYRRAGSGGPSTPAATVTVTPILSARSKGIGMVLRW